MLARLTILIALALPMMSMSPSVHAYNYADGHESYVSKNYYKAFRQWYVLAKKGNARAKAKLARLLIEGKIKGAKTSEAHRYLKEIKDENLSEADYLWGVIHRDGLGAEPNQKKAIEFFQKCAEKDNAECSKALVLILIDGSSLGKCEADKLAIIKQCAKNQDRECQFFLYQTLEACEGSVSESTQDWLRRAADNGFPEAQIEYGVFLRKQHKNIEADNIFKMVSKNPDATKEQRQEAENLIKSIVWAYADGEKLLEQGNCSGAIGIWEKASNSFPEATYRLGEIHEEGTCDSRDISKAITYYRDALRQGYPKAKASLCRIFMDRQIKRPDAVKVFELKKLFDPPCFSVISKRAADSGHPRAQIAYGKSLKEQGANNEASKYFEMAQANPDATKEQKIAAKNLTRGISYTYEDGKKLFDAGNCSGAMGVWAGLFESSPESAYKLGEIFEEGRCGAKDFARAKTYYSSALDQRHPKAALSLCRVYVNEGTIGEIAGVKAYEACVEAVRVAESPGDKKTAEAFLERSMPPLQLAKTFVSKRQCKDALQVVSNYLEKSQKPEDLLYAGEFYLGDVCTTKDVQTIDVPKAKMLLLGIASNSETTKTTDAKAAHSLGIIAYFTGNDRVSTKRYFTKAKDAGIANAYYYLGLIEGARSPGGIRSHQSPGTQYVAQKELFQKGERHDDAQSMLGLAMMYMDGQIGLPWSRSDRALALVRKAEKKNHRDAYYYLAKAHEEEWGDLTSDRSLQTQLYQKSADLGSVLGTHYLCSKKQSLPHCKWINSHPFAKKMLGIR